VNGESALPTPMLHTTMSIMTLPEAGLPIPLSHTTHLPLRPAQPQTPLSPLPLPWPGPSEDLYSFDIASRTWTKLYAMGGSPPPARHAHGFTLAGGKLYVHGGRSWNFGWGSAPPLLNVYI
jgi:hypothetical protein